jgi:hypothetical protein
MQFVISSRLTGTLQHLFVDDNKLMWVDEMPQNVYQLSGEYKQFACLDTLCRLNNIAVDFLDERYKNVFSTLFPNKTIDYLPNKLLMPKQHYLDYLKNIVNQINSNQHLLDKKYYEQTWVPSTGIFDLLQPSMIDVEKWQKLINSDDCGNKPVVKSFISDNDGYCGQTIYDRFGTRTGRLTVESGPQILTLKRDLRNILKSRFKNGNIAYYDFRALEVRIVLYEAGKQCLHTDVYQFINDDLFENKADRDVIKKVVIAKLYGRSDELLGNDLGIKNTKLHVFVDKITQYFNFDKLYKRVKNQYQKDLFVYNKYGRKILTPEPLPHILFNSFVQSTGVDVTLLGFTDICKNILSPNDIPLFLLHDAILFDTQDVNKLPEIVWLKIPGFVQKFPVKKEIIS